MIVHRPTDRGGWNVVDHHTQCRRTTVCPVTNADPAMLAAATLASATGAPSHDVAVVMGSGWQSAADALGVPLAEVDLARIPGFAVPTSVGHGGSARSVLMGDRRVLLLMGRTHLYEGRGIGPVVHGVRTAVAAGAGTVILTNAAGGLRAGLRVGQLVLIADQLNLTARSPLSRPERVDSSQLYSAELRSVARAIDSSLVEGVYAQLSGPHFETPAEIRMLRRLGADLVGMSTAVETIAAKAAGAQVLGLSLVSNLAAGMTGAPLDADEVIQAGRRAGPAAGLLLAAVIAALPTVTREGVTVP